MSVLKLLTLFSLTLAASVSAQTGQSGVSTSSPLGNVKAFSELRAFGACFAKTQRKDALAIIATDPGSAEEEKVMRKLIFGEDKTTCMFGGTTMTMPNIFARGAIAEGLLRSDGVPDGLRLTAPLPADVRDLHGVARCYTQGHRQDVEAMLRTQSGSPEELTAMKGIWPGFAACMPKLGARLNAPWIRFLLAEALLRLPPDAGKAGQ